MFDDSRSFISRAYLQSIYDIEFKIYREDGRDIELLERLKAWDARTRQTETQDESAFITTFFDELWGFEASGRRAGDGYTIIPKLGVTGAGARGGAGEVDVALGWFKNKADAVPQVLCEFKDIRSGLDAKQNRKGSNLTPVEQCLNYVRGARHNQFGNEAVQPWWGLATDMNEFRLYWWDRAPREFVKFTIRRKKESSQQELFEQRDLLSDGLESQFDRFLFSKLFHRDMLIANSGRPALWRVVERQWLREKNIEEEFYQHYKDVRERLFKVLRVSNTKFPGTPTDLLRISQKLLDRFIFAFYCEDMGERMLFPPQFIRDHLIDRSKAAYYETEGEDIWPFFKRLFKFMNTGGKFGQMLVPHINGGLFDDDPMIDGLSIPNHIFAAHGQGLNEASLAKDKETLLYLSARYNYAAKGDAKESLSLYTLGRIFEQSITELEFRVGELEGRDTVAKLSKRKRDGVYYTPERVVNYLVEETLGPWFATAKQACGDNPKTYLEKLRGIRIIDPACGSGAFLISAFRRLLDERKIVAREILGDNSVLDEAVLIADILQNNIYGVDINPSSVEIAKLALWLHSARANAPLSTLDHTIRCGNSLVRPDCWGIITRNAKNEARVNPFDWGDERYDIVLGNPPYVKLQNLMKVDPDVVAYLQAQRAVGTYESAQTGNFDLYLPFIELGLRLLNEGGRMAYIAPSLWAVNEYGRGLRGVLHRTRQLERWIDFKSYQVFDEAITYTALQFFTHDANENVKVVISPEGEMGDIDWDDETLAIPSVSLRDDTEWLMVTGEDRDVIVRLAQDCLRLDDPIISTEIFQGIKTGADQVYKLRKLRVGLYLCTPDKGEPFEVELEDELLYPILSGSEAKRYITPSTDVYLLFPYVRRGRSVQIIPILELEKTYPLCWSYLQKWKNFLVKRDNGELDIEHWYQFSRSQGLNKFGTSKIVAAGTVPSLRLSYDEVGSFFLTGGRVDGIIQGEITNPWFLLGVLNAPLADFVFRRVGRPKQGGWFEANKQFIAPLPIPHADIKAQKVVGAMAKDLQERWTNRRDLLEEAGKRLSVLGRARHTAKWLWSDLPSLQELRKEAPRKLLPAEKTAWATAQFDEKHGRLVDALQGVLSVAGRLDAGFEDGELKLFSGGAVVLDKIFLDAGEGQLALAYWRYVVLSRQQRDAKSLASLLCRVPQGHELPAARQFVEKVAALAEQTHSIRAKEKALNAKLYELYGLSPDERQLIENDCAKRPVL